MNKKYAKSCPTCHTFNKRTNLTHLISRAFISYCQLVNLDKYCLAIFDFPSPRVSLLATAWHPAPSCCSKRLMTALHCLQMMVLFSQCVTCDCSCLEFMLWKHSTQENRLCVLSQVLVWMLSHCVFLPRAFCSGGLKSTCTHVCIQPVMTCQPDQGVSSSCGSRVRSSGTQGIRCIFLHNS